MTIHFFVGSEFSKDTDFVELNKAIKSLQPSNKGLHEIIFYPCDTKNIDAIANQFKADDVIIGASAGGLAASSLAKKVQSLKKIMPIVIGFEPVAGLGEIDNVITIIQADNPKNIHYNNHLMYKLTDNNHAMLSGKKRYVYGHAFYAIHPMFLRQLQYDNVSAKRLDNSHYILIPDAGLNANSKTYHEKMIIAKTCSKESSELDTITTRVFRLNLIQNIVNACIKHNLDHAEIADHLKTERLAKSNPARRVY